MSDIRNHLAAYAPDRVLHAWRPGTDITPVRQCVNDIQAERRDQRPGVVSDGGWWGTYGRTPVELNMDNLPRLPYYRDNQQIYRNAVDQWEDLQPAVRAAVTRMAASAIGRGEIFPARIGAGHLCRHMTRPQLASTAALGSPTVLAEVMWATQERSEDWAAIRKDRSVDAVLLDSAMALFSDGATAFSKAMRHYSEGEIVLLSDRPDLIRKCDSVRHVRSLLNNRHLSKADRLSLSEGTRSEGPTRLLLGDTGVVDMDHTLYLALVGLMPSAVEPSEWDALAEAYWQVAASREIHPALARKVMAVFSAPEARPHWDVARDALPRATFLMPERPWMPFIAEFFEQELGGNLHDWNLATELLDGAGWEGTGRELIETVQAATA